MVNKKIAMNVSDEIHKILKSSNKEEILSSLNKLAYMADLLDKAGNEDGANYVDGIIKDAGWLSNFFEGGLLGGGADVVQELLSGQGKDSILSKEGLTKLLRGALIGGSSNVIIRALMENLENLPYIGFLFKNDTINRIAADSISVALSQSDFIDKLVDNIITHIKQIFTKDNDLENKPLAGTEQAQQLSDID